MLSSFIPYATYEIMLYNNYASTTTLCLFHSRPPGHPVHYDILPTLPLRTSEDLTTPTSGITPTSCHLRNIDTPGYPMRHSTCVNSSPTPVIRLLRQKTNSKSSTMMSTPTPTNPTFRSFIISDDRPLKSTTTKSCSDFMSTRTPVLPLIESARYSG